MAYDVPLRMLTVTPTRDGHVNPSRRLPDKHTRLMCGKTLDEWMMIQLWSSKYVAKSIFVCETKAHAEKLAPMAEKYGITLSVRPYDFNHPLNDSGLYPIFHEVDKVLRSDDYYSLLMTPFVVAPCRPPGFIDSMVEEYVRRVGGADFNKEVPLLLGCSTTQLRLFTKDADGRGADVTAHVVSPFTDLVQSITSHTVQNTYWYWTMEMIAMSRCVTYDKYRPMIMEIEPWMDIHIDSEDEWQQAEYWFKEKILSQGEDCYERYHRGR